MGICCRKESSVDQVTERTNLMEQNKELFSQNTESGVVKGESKKEELISNKPPETDTKTPEVRALEKMEDYVHHPPFEDTEHDSDKPLVVPLGEILTRHPTEKVSVPQVEEDDIQDTPNQISGSPDSNR
eukprot:TRINITY_DN7783_c0_g1_i1.p1 TRINITY_DN7783_c0_g1~~TRINITY_DN7783_c0_g1_i1.p1  ORF type:complete len:129 (+),score=38.08 TRINITY_DN7783_c0_g1_i1:95-481(+)